MPPAKKRKVASTRTPGSVGSKTKAGSDTGSVGEEGPLADDGVQSRATTASLTGELDEHGGPIQEETEVVVGIDALVNDPALLDEEEAPDIEASLGGKRKFAGGYNALKSFNGQTYSGMSIGSSHNWNYDQGVWRETKEEPDLWKIDYATTKRRARNAPSGSGAPVGTEYHWFIVAHQYVRKVDANTYSTHLVGSKYKLAHKNANSESWSINTVKGQRERELFLLEDAKRRVEGLPPVLGAEKVKVPRQEKGQKTIESLFSKATAKKEVQSGGGKEER